MIFIQCILLLLLFGWTLSPFWSHSKVSLLFCWERYVINGYLALSVFQMSWAEEEADNYIFEWKRKTRTWLPGQRHLRWRITKSIEMMNKEHLCGRELHSIIYFNGRRIVHSVSAVYRHQSTWKLRKRIHLSHERRCSHSSILRLLPRPT